MDEHVIYNAAIPRRRPLRNNDSSRFGTLRLVIQTQGPDLCVVSVVRERVGGGAMDGTRLAFARISRTDGEGVMLGTLELLERALDALRRQA